MGDRKGEKRGWVRLWEGGSGGVGVERGKQGGGEGGVLGKETDSV